MATRVFKFSVDDKGVFKYEPVGTEGQWRYTHDDTVEFHCKKGPFTIRQRRTDTAIPNLPDPFGGPIEAKKVGNTWVASTGVTDGLSGAFRSELFRRMGFISKYRYVFGVMNGAEIALDDNQPGIQTC